MSLRKWIIPISIIFVFFIISCESSPAVLADQYIGGWDVVSLDYIGTEVGDYMASDLTTTPGEAKAATLEISNSEFVQYNLAGELKLKNNVDVISNTKFKSTVSDPGFEDIVTGTVFYWELAPVPGFSNRIYLHGYAERAMSTLLGTYTCEMP